MKKSDEECKTFAFINDFAPLEWVYLFNHCRGPNAIYLFVANEWDALIVLVHSSDKVQLDCVQVTDLPKTVIHFTKFYPIHGIYIDTISTTSNLQLRSRTLWSLVCKCICVISNLIHKSIEHSLKSKKCPNTLLGWNMRPIQCVNEHWSIPMQHSS